MWWDCQPPLPPPRQTSSCWALFIFVCRTCQAAATSPPRITTHSEKNENRRLPLTNVLFLCLIMFLSIYLSSGFAWLPFQSLLLCFRQFTEKITARQTPFSSSISTCLFYGSRPRAIHWCHKLFGIWRKYPTQEARVVSVRIFKFLCIYKKK